MIAARHRLCAGRAVRAGLSLCLSATLWACKGGADDTHFTVDAIGLLVPKQAGWLADPELEQVDLDRGGTALRLIRENAPLGSPRIEVILSPDGQGTTLEAFLTQQLAQMGQLERDPSGQVRITVVRQEPIRVGARRAHLVRHEYTMGKAENQLAFVQLTAIFVVDGRGVAVTALGRNELYAPLADSVRRVLTGLKLQDDESDKPEPSPKKPNNHGITEVKPVDLGTVGGK